jgi:hypothetical protein
MGRAADAGAPAKPFIVDSDAHYFEPLEEILKYVPEPWRRRMAKQSPRNLLPNSMGDREVAGRIRRDNVSYPLNPMSPKEVPAAMEFLGVDVSILVSQRLITFGAVPAKDMAVALANGYIDYMLDQVVEPDRGIYTSVVAPTQHSKRAAELIRRVGKERGVAAICLMTDRLEPPMGDTIYHPIYQAALETDLPIVFHGGGAGLLDLGIRGFQRFISSHTLGFQFFNVVQATSLLEQGIPEKYPGLKIVFQECGLFWAAGLMARLDASYRKRREEMPLFKKLPSDYMREWYYTNQPLEEPKDPRHLRFVFEMIDAERTLMYASDYPHWDFDPPRVIQEIPFLSQEAKANILGNTARKVYKLRGKT